MNRTHTLFKLVMHDVMDTWLCTRRLHEGRFHDPGVFVNQQLTAKQFQTLSYGLS